MRQVERSTLVNEGCSRLEGLARALGFHSDEARLVRTFQQMTASWKDTLIGDAPAWPSDVCDDHTPFEFSVAFHRGEPELRILAEAMDFPASIEANRRAGLRLTEELSEAYGFSLDRFRLLEDLFLPKEPQGRFLLWHAAVFAKNRAPEFKIYFNLHVQGKSKAPVLTEAALRRLGFDKAWSTVAEVMSLRSSEQEELLYFSLDLADRPDARVKVYVRHHDGNAADLERASSYARSYRAGAVTQFSNVLGGGPGPYGGRGPATCFSFTDPKDDRPASATTYIPMPWAAPTDLLARDRFVAFMKDSSIETAGYDAVLESFVRHPLDAGSSLHSYAAFRQQDGARVTAYFAPELYKAEPPRSAPSVWTKAPKKPAPDLVAHFETNPVTDHPLLARLAREPVDLRKLAIIMANFEVAVIRDFPRRLAALTARAPDEAIRSILAKQLNDELGNGDIDKAHRVIFQRITRALEPFRPKPSELEPLLAAGRAHGETLERCYVLDDPYAGVGASLLVEVGGKQVDILIGDQFRRQTDILHAELEWLNLHETLELEHADEAMDLAKLIPAGAPNEAAWRGAFAIADSTRALFDRLYGVVFS